MAPKEEIIEYNQIETNPYYSDFEIIENNLNEETFKEISTDKDIQMTTETEINCLTTSRREQIIDSNPSATNTKIFLCYICNKEFKIHFHLKQHTRKAHEKKAEAAARNSLKRP